MPHSSAAQESLAPLTQAATYPDDLLPELQTMLAALADLEVRYEKDREQLTVNQHRMRTLSRLPLRT